jgi:hypothetical protein
MYYLITSAPLFVNDDLARSSAFYVNSDCSEVDAVILEIVTNKNNYADIVAEKLLLNCFTSWDAYQCR